MTLFHFIISYLKVTLHFKVFVILDQLSGKNLLGIGAYGKVFKYLDRRSGMEVAVKEVELGLVENSKYKEVSHITIPAQSVQLQISR